MKRSILTQGRLFWALALAVAVAPMGGCIGFFAHLMYVFQGGPQVPAECDLLKGKRVAVVCVSSGSAYGPDSAASTMARQVGLLLRQNIDDIDVVSHTKVEDWIDNHHWDEGDFLEIGRGLKADYLVAIDVRSMSLQDGQTLYKGRADVSLSVFDMADDGVEVFSEQDDNFAYPVNSVHHVHDMTRAKFRRMFLAKLSTHLAQRFYSYPLAENFAQDTTVF